MRLRVTIEPLTTDKTHVLEGNVVKNPRPYNYLDKWFMQVDAASTDGINLSPGEIPAIASSMRHNSSAPTRKGVLAALQEIYKYEGQKVEVVG